MKGGRGKSKAVTLASVRLLKDVPTATLYRETDPTPERLQQAGYTIASEVGTRRTQIIYGRHVTPIGADGVVRLNQAPLDRLHARGLLGDQSGDAAQDEDANRQRYEAGSKLRNHYYLAGLSGFAANDPNASGGGHPASRTPITETMESNRRAMRLAESSMNAGDWRVVSTVVCDERTLVEAGRQAGYQNENAAAAVALDRLRRGLDELAAIWGYSPPQRPQPPAPQAANDAPPVLTAARA